MNKLPDNSSEYLVEADPDSDDKNDEIYQALQLRFSFRDFHFVPSIWPCLKQLGWIARHGGYQAPNNGRFFHSAIALSDYMDDTFALPPIWSDLHSPTLPTNEDHVGAQLRRDFLKLWYARNKLPDEKVDKASKVAASLATPASRASRPTRRPATSVAAKTPPRSDEDLTSRHSNKRKRPDSDLTFVEDAAMAHVPSTFPNVDQCAALLGDYWLEPVSQHEARLIDLQQWRFLLSTHHSLMFYGVGSKESVIKALTGALPADGSCLAIQGDDKKMTLQAALDVIVRCWLEREPQTMSSIPLHDSSDTGVDVPVTGWATPWRSERAELERAIVIGRALAVQASQDDVPFYLIISSLDQGALSSELSQEALALLHVNSRVANGVPALRIVATVNHVDAPLLLGGGNLHARANLSWMHIPCHTFRPHSACELAAAIGTTQQARGRQAAQQEARAAIQVERVLAVLDNLAKGHAEVLGILARLQLESDNVTWTEFRDACQHAFAVSREEQLRAYLVELQDHGLVQVVEEDGSKQQSGTEQRTATVTVRVPYDRPRLVEMVATLDARFRA